MRKMKNLLLLLFTGSTLLMSGCLHILEEVTVRQDGSGTYKMTIDMSEIKGMMSMFEGMSDSTETDSTAIGDDGMDMGADNSMSQLGEEMTNVTQSLEGLPGLSNLLGISDTSTFIFGYSFDFENIAALNRALKVINKEKYDAKTEEVFQLQGRNFERLATSNLGEEIKKAMAEGEDEAEPGSMEMVKMFFADMSYKQIYHFPDRTIRKSSNSLSEISDDKHTITITIKPFDEEQQKNKATVATTIKLK